MPMTILRRGICRMASHLALAAIVSSLTLPTHAADPSYIYGIHWYGDPASGDAEALSGGKALWDLETVMLYDGGWNLAAQGAKFQQVVNKGHTVIIRVQPQWGLVIPNNTAARNQYLIDIQAAANQAKNYCHIWQIGNENNLGGEYGGAQLDPVDYINFYKQVRAAIKNVQSPLGPQIVLVAPVSPGGPGGDRWMDGNQYLGTMCSNMTVDDCDGFGLHGYGAPWSNSDQATAEFADGYQSQLRVIDEKGFAAKPAYITEFNRQVNPVNAANESESAAFCTKAFQNLQNWNANAANHKVACACWFIYPNDPGVWSSFSIVYLRSLHTRGVNLDLWDTFQYACTLNIPSGGQSPYAAAVVDNVAATFSGTWITASSATDKYGPDYRYKFGAAGAPYAEFRPSVAAGSTNVYAWWSQGANRSTAVPYQITHAAGTTTANANQQTNGGKWNLLGTHAFNSGTGGYVRLVDNYDAGKVGIADAMKFVTVTPAEIIIDNADVAFTASANWSTGTSAADKYGANYRFRATQALGDSATWTFKAPQNRNYEIYAWWSQGSNRSSSAPYVVAHSQGNATVLKNQQAGGGAWQSLGTFYFLSGTNNVKLSCWTTTGFIVLADAVRIVPR